MCIFVRILVKVHKNRDNLNNRSENAWFKSLPENLVLSLVARRTPCMSYILYTRGYLMPVYNIKSLFLGTPVINKKKYDYLHLQLAYSQNNKSNQYVQIFINAHVDHSN